MRVIPRYRCMECRTAFPGQRMFCRRCTAETVARAKERVPCQCGRTKRPDEPCKFHVEAA